MPLVTRLANAGTLFKQSATPGDVTSGNLWIDTSTTPPFLKISNGTSYVGLHISVGGLVNSIENFIMVSN